jgi:Hsp20/alpha crystallin family
MPHRERKLLIDRPVPTQRRSAIVLLTLLVLMWGCASVHRRERVWGGFDRTLSVPIQIDPDAVKAEYRNGVLALFIPRAESDKPRSIKIN